jgi:hypothetical protein
MAGAHSRKVKHILIGFLIALQGKKEKKRFYLFANRVARWYFFKPKIQIWENLGVS